jgi:sulfur-carrier protein
MQAGTAPTVEVHIPPALRDRTGNQRCVQVGGSTVRDVLQSLEQAYPGIGFNIRYETGEVRPYVNIFVGTEEIRYLQGLDTPVPAGSTMHIVHSVAGG